jgi:hypothetical protein
VGSLVHRNECSGYIKCRQCLGVDEPLLIFQELPHGINYIFTPINTSQISLHVHTVSTLNSIVLYCIVLYFIFILQIQTVTKPLDIEHVRKVHYKS